MYSLHVGRIRRLILFLSDACLVKHNHMIDRLSRNSPDDCMPIIFLWLLLTF